MSHGTIQINQARCKGCSLCAAFCPQEVISLDGDHLNARGYHPAQLSVETGCTGCGICAIVCPDACITVYREPVSRKATLSPVT